VEGEALLRPLTGIQLLIKTIPTWCCFFILPEKMSKTLVLGASTNPTRYAFMAVQRLSNYGIAVAAVGLKPGTIADVEIQTGMPEIANVDTVTLYLGPQNQPPYYDYILSLKPRRVIFNPGTENPEFEAMLTEHGIEAPSACTLVMLSVGNY
jgi:predicted CoA-binding protein